MDLRLSGHTVREIGRTLGLKPRVMEEHLARGLEIVRADTEEERQALRLVEVERLDACLRMAMPLVTASKLLVTRTENTAGGPVVEVHGEDTELQLKAIDRVLKIGKRRAELLGLDAPVKVEQMGASALESLDVFAARVAAAKTANFQPPVLGAAAPERHRSPRRRRGTKAHRLVIAIVPRSDDFAVCLDAYGLSEGRPAGPAAALELVEQCLPARGWHPHPAHRVPMEDEALGRACRRRRCGGHSLRGYDTYDLTDRGAQRIAYARAGPTRGWRWGEHPSRLPRQSFSARGGYLARTKDPPPGRTVTWRGLYRLADLLLGVELDPATCG